VLQTTTDDYDRRQRASLVWPLYNMCRRASIKIASVKRDIRSGSCLLCCLFLYKIVIL